MAKALPRSASGMPFYQTKRLVARVLEDKVLANAKCVTAAERTAFAPFFRDWMTQQYGLKDTADAKVLTVIKTTRLHGATKLYHKGNMATSESKFDARLWVFGQLTGITDKGGEGGGEAGLEMSIDARAALAEYAVDLVATMYATNLGGINESLVSSPSRLHLPRGRQVTGRG